MEEEEAEAEEEDCEADDEGKAKTSVASAEDVPVSVSEPEVPRAEELSAVVVALLSGSVPVDVSTGVLITTTLPSLAVEVLIADSETPEKAEDSCAPSDTTVLLCTKTLPSLAVIVITVTEFDVCIGATWLLSTIT